MILVLFFCFSFVLLGVFFFLFGSFVAAYVCFLVSFGLCFFYVVFFSHLLLTKKRIDIIMWYWQYHTPLSIFGPVSLVICQIFIFLNVVCCSKFLIILFLLIIIVPLSFLLYNRVCYICLLVDVCFLIAFTFQFFFICFVCV